MYKHGGVHDPFLRLNLYIARLLLFRPDADYVSVLSAEVLRQMEEQMAADASLSYLTDEFTAIDPEQSFYWNADGDLVLVFDEYAVAAGYIGMVEFTIPQDVYSALLK